MTLKASGPPFRDCCIVVRLCKFDFEINQLEKQHIDETSSWMKERNYLMDFYSQNGHSIHYHFQYSKDSIVEL